MYVLQSCTGCFIDTMHDLCEFHYKPIKTALILEGDFQDLSEKKLYFGTRK